MATILLPPLSASAQAEPSEVEALIKQALDLRREGKDALAYPLLQQAHERGSTPRTAAQLGLVEINLGYWLEAERHLSESLAARKNVWVHQHRAVLEQNLEKARAAIGEITIVGPPAGAEVLVNGQAVGRAPLPSPVRLGEGPARIEVRAPGHVTAKRALSVAGGRREEVSIALEKETTPSTLPVPSPTPPASDTTGGQLIDTPPARGLGNWARPTAWATAALGAGSLTFAIIQSLQWRDKRRAFDEHRPTPSADPDCGAKDPNHGGPGCDALYQDMNRAKTRAIVGYVGGGLLAAGSATLFILSRPTREPPTLACAATLQPYGAGCRLHF